MQSRVATVEGAVQLLTKLSTLFPVISVCTRVFRKALFTVAEKLEATKKSFKR